MPPARPTRGRRRRHRCVGVPLGARPDRRSRAPIRATSPYEHPARRESRLPEHLTLLVDDARGVDHVPDGRSPRPPASPNETTLSAGMPFFAPSPTSSARSPARRAGRATRPSWHRPSSSRQRPRHAPHGLPEAVGRHERRGRLEAGMDAAVLAARVVARAVVLPLDALEQRLVAREDAVRQQVARALPAVRVARDRAPRRARKLPLAR